VGEFGHFIGGRGRRAVGEIGRACILVKIYCLCSQSAPESDCGKAHQSGSGAAGEVVVQLPKGRMMKGSEGAPGFRLRWRGARRPSRDCWTRTLGP
jgi:hypothetical protein